jgi:hypothetical protein
LDNVAGSTDTILINARQVTCGHPQVSCDLPDCTVAQLLEGAVWVGKLRRLRGVGTFAATVPNDRFWTASSTVLSKTRLAR